MVYHLTLKPASSSQLNQVLDLLKRNRIRLIEAIPDPPRSVRDKEKDRLTRRADSSIDKNPQHDYLERKIKELARKP